MALAVASPPPFSSPINDQEGQAHGAAQHERWLTREMARRRKVSRRKNNSCTPRVAKRKRASSSISCYSDVHSNDQQVPMYPRIHLSVQELEEKKTLLPYLAKLSYIEQHLLERGRSARPSLALDNEISRLKISSFRRSNLFRDGQQGMRRRRLNRVDSYSSLDPELDRARRWKRRPRATYHHQIREDSPDPDIDSEKNRGVPEKKSSSGEASKPQGQEYADIHSPSAEPSSLGVVQSEDVQGEEAGAIKATLGLYSLLSDRLSMTEQMLQKQILVKKPVTWVLRTVERVYDAAWRFEESMAEGLGPSATRIAMKKCATSTLAVDAWCLESATDYDKIHGIGDGGFSSKIASSDSELELHLVFARYLEETFGKGSVLTQVVLDFVYSLELHRDSVPELNLFSLFCRGVYSKEALALFLVARNRAQTLAGLSLDVLRSPIMGKQWVPTYLTRAVPHSSVCGAKVVLLHSQSCNELIEWLLREGNQKWMQCDPENGASAMKLLGDSRGRSKWGSAKGWVSLQELLESLVRHLHAAPDDIADQVKCGGNEVAGTAALDSLQAFPATEERLKQLGEEIDAATVALKATEFRIDKIQSSQGGTLGSTADGANVTFLWKLRSDLVHLDSTVKSLKAEAMALNCASASAWDSMTQAGVAGNDPHAEDLSVQSSQRKSSLTQRSLAWFCLWMDISLKEKAAERSKEDIDYEHELAIVRNASACVIQERYRAWKSDEQAISAARKLADELRWKRDVKERELAAARSRQILRVQTLLREQRSAAQLRGSRDRLIREQAVMFEVERRYWVSRRRMTQPLFARWRRERDISRLRLKRKSRLKRYFLYEWRRGVNLQLKRQNAASTVQRAWRRWMAWREANSHVEILRQFNDLMHSFAESRQSHSLRLALHCWHRFARLRAMVRSMRSSNLNSLLKSRLRCWENFTSKCVARKVEAALQIQCAYRQFHVRRLAARARAEARAMNMMKAWICRYTARHQKQKLESALRSQAGLVSSFLSRHDDFLKASTFESWRSSIRADMAARKAVGALGMRIQAGRLAATFVEWRKDAQKSAEQRRLTSRAATMIQNWWRCWQAQQILKILQRKHAAALSIQKVARGWLARTSLSHQFSARTIQRIWRGYISRCNEPEYVMGFAVEAVGADNLVRLKWLCERWPQLPCLVCSHGGMLAHSAASAGSSICIKYLCEECNADINALDWEGRTPLLCAVRATSWRRDSVCKYLLECGSDLFWKDHAYESALTLAARIGYASTLRLLWDWGADPADVDGEGKPPLVLAIEGGHSAAVDVLLRFGANPSQPSSSLLLSPLHVAIGCGSETAVLEALIQQGANVNAPDMDGVTPLMYAIHANDARATSLLCDAGANLDLTDAEGRTALSMALANGQLDALHELLAFGIDIDMQDVYGDTALHNAARGGQEEITRELVLAGANVNIRNNRGDSPAHLAAAVGAHEVMSILIEYGALVGQRNWAERTPLGEARMAGGKGATIVQLLQDSFTPAQLDESMEAQAADPDWDRKLYTDIGNSDWEERFDEQHQKMVWFNVVTGSTSEMSPFTTTAERVAALSAGADVHYRRRRGRRTQGAKLEAKAPPLPTDSSYRRFHAEVFEAIEQERKEIWAARMIQTRYRGKRSRAHAAELRRARRAMEIIGSASMRRIRQIRDRKRRQIYRAAAAIQALFRGVLARREWYAHLWSDLWWHRAERRLACATQRIWRGHYYGRRVARLMDAQRRWGMGPEIMAPAQLVRIHGDCEEYLVWNMLDLKFYRHITNGDCYWDQPEQWRQADQDEWEERMFVLTYGYSRNASESARRIQGAFRASRCRRQLHRILTSQDIARHSEEEYLKNPDSLVRKINYVLMLHAMRHDYARARPLYVQSVAAMEARGPDIDILCYAFALFGMVTGEEDVLGAMSLVERARAAQAEGPDCRRPRCFATAEVGFFRFAAMHQGGCEAWHNYALVLWLVQEDYAKALDCFIRAVEANPKDKRAQENFASFLLAFPEQAQGKMVFDFMKEHSVRMKASQAERQRLEQESYLARSDVKNAARLIERAWLRRKTDLIAAHGKYMLGSTLQILQEARAESEAFKAIAASSSEKEQQAVIAHTGNTSVLPPDWDEAVDPSTGIAYYFHTSGMSQWEHPSSTK